MGGVDLAPITIYIMGLLIAGTLYSKINLRTRFVAVINRGEGGPRSVGMPETGLEVIVQKCLTSSINKKIWSGLPPPGWYIRYGNLQISVLGQVTKLRNPTNILL